MWYSRMLLLWLASVGAVWGSDSRQLTSGENLAGFGLSPSQVDSLCARRAGVSNLVRTVDYLIEVADRPATPLAANSLDSANAGSLNTTAPEKERDGDAE